MAPDVQVDVVAHLRLAADQRLKYRPSSRSASTGLEARTVAVRRR